MEGYVRVIVNLKTPSVEYVGEKGDDRYSRVLRGDKMTAEAIIAEDYEIMINPTPEDKIAFVVDGLKEMVKNLDNMDYFLIRRFRNSTSIPPSEISFVTLEATGDFWALIND